MISAGFAVAAGRQDFETIDGMGANMRQNRKTDYVLVSEGSDKSTVALLEDTL
ncbi:MAG: hypothetical protein AAFN40_24500 [Cyanobacteria bacterium J06560_6]